MVRHMKTLHEVVADVDPDAVTAVEQVVGKRGGKKQVWRFKVTQAEGLHTLFSAAFRGATENGFVAVSLRTDTFGESAAWLALEQEPT